MAQSPALSPQNVTTHFKQNCERTLTLSASWILLLLENLGVGLFCFVFLPERRSVLGLARWLSE